MPAPRDEDRANAMTDLYRDGNSLERVAAAFGVTRQTVYMMLKRRGVEFRPKPPPLPFVVFGGRRYTLRRTGYYGCTVGRRGYLHRHIWEAHNGRIPDSFDIHHIDRDKANNRIGNLELIDKAEHARRYPGRKSQHTGQVQHRRCRGRGC